jgi:hypothetical protein
MRHLLVIGAGLITIGLVAVPTPAQQKGADGGWVTLFNGSNLNNFRTLGDANWTIADGAVQADKGNGFLVTKESYRDFEFSAEFWVDEKANSGVFIRCTDPQKVDAQNAYEVNIFDTRPDPKYATASIVNVAESATVVKAGGKWNTFLITAQGPHMTVVFNGMKTVDARNEAHVEGPIALQYAAGVVKFKNVRIRRL